MVRLYFRLLKTELKYARLVHHECFLNDCFQRNIIPYDFRSEVTPCLRVGFVYISERME